MIITMRFPEGRAKTLTLSYDDGVKQDERLIKILDAHGIKCTFNINSGWMNNMFDPEGGRMRAEEVRARFENSPHEVAIHGLDHAHEDVLHDNIMANEILQDRKNLEQITGRIIRGMAYPFGNFNDRLVKCLEVCGIVYSRTCITTRGFGMPNDWLRLAATCHHAYEGLDGLCDRFLAMNPGMPQMFYMWGHSYEFDRNEPHNNWDVIEKFAEKMGGHDDIWYATNIEIYDYTKAYESLQFATDQSMVHNPTATDVWFNASVWHQNKTFCVKAGETLRLADEWKLQ